MQIFSTDQIIEMLKITYDIVNTFSMAIFHALFINIATYFNDLFTGDHKTVSLIMLAGSIVMLVRFAKARKLSFIRSIMNN